MNIINKINKYFVRPSKEWLNDYYAFDSSITSADITVYAYPQNHLNYIKAEKYLNKIIKILKKDNYIINKISFTKSQPCIYESKNDLTLTPGYFWSNSGKIKIYLDSNYQCSKFNLYIIERMIFKLNEKFEYLCDIYFKDKKIYHSDVV